MEQNNSQGSHNGFPKAYDSAFQYPHRLAPYPDFEVKYAPVGNPEEHQNASMDSNPVQRLSSGSNMSQAPKIHPAHHRSNSQNSNFNVGNQSQDPFQNYAKPQHIPQNQAQLPVPSRTQSQTQNRAQSYVPNQGQNISMSSNLFGPSVCTAHHKALKYICKDEICTQRLLCEVCVESQLHKDVATNKELLDASLLYILELYAKEEESVFKPVDDRYHGVCSTISSSFEDLRAQINELLIQSEERAKARAKEYFLQPKSKKWVGLKEEYTSAKAAYLKVQSKGQSKELDEFVQTVNKVLHHKKEKEQDSIQEVLEVQKKEMTQMLQRFKGSLSLIMDKLYPNVSGMQEHDSKFDGSALKYFKGVKTNNKLTVNSILYISKLDQVVTGSETGTISTWNPRTFDPIMTYNVHDGAINSMIYLEKESLLFTGAKDTFVQIFPVTPGGLSIPKAQVLVGHTEAVRSLLYLEGEERVASAGEDPDIKIWNVRTGNLEMTISTKGWRSSGDEMAFIRPQKWIAVAGKKEIKIFDYVTKECVITQAAKAVGSMEYLMEKQLFVMQEESEKISLWKVDAEKKKLRKEKKFKLPMSLKKPAYFKCIESSELGLVSTGTNKVFVYDLATGGLIKQIETNLQSTTCITWLKNERRILIGDSGSGLLGLLQY